jgi:hypothetical protein
VGISGGGRKVKTFLNTRINKIKKYKNLSLCFNFGIVYLTNRMGARSKIGYTYLGSLLLRINIKNIEGISKNNKFK